MSFHKCTYCLFGGWGWSSKILQFYTLQIAYVLGEYMETLALRNGTKKICALGSVRYMFSKI